MSLWSKLLLNPSIPVDRAWVIVLFTAVSSLYLCYQCCGKSRSRAGFHHGCVLVVWCVIFFWQEFWSGKSFGKPVACAPGTNLHIIIHSERWWTLVSITDQWWTLVSNAKVSLNPLVKSLDKIKLCVLKNLSRDLLCALDPDVIMIFLVLGYLERMLGLSLVILLAFSDGH